jgi:glycosyltransferase involved in cell wall biosynthesis
MTNQLVLIFAYHYPPENTIGGARPFRFLKYLTRLGYKCRVFTAADQLGRSDPNVEYVPDPFVTHQRRSARWQKERLIRKLFLPGELGMAWSSDVVRAARAFIQANPDFCPTIFSTFPPLGPHLAALRLAHAEEIPWIADFRDALYDESMIKGNDFQKWFIRRMERKLMAAADAVIANTDASMMNLQQRFPEFRKKVHVIWNGYDPNERILPLPTSVGNCRELSHTGELYGGRNATPILESISRLIAAGRIPVGNIRVRLIGRAESGTVPNEQFLARAIAEGWLDFVPVQIPKSEALRIARASHGLLLLQLQSASHLPAKIFEYLQIGRPILAFAVEGSPTERVLEQSGVVYRCVYPGSPPEVIDNTVADFFRLQHTPVVANSWFEQQFNVENQTRQLDAIIRSLHGELPRDTNSSSGLLSATESARNTEEAALNIGDRTSL